jgi:hypothetical protein
MKKINDAILIIESNIQRFSNYSSIPFLILIITTLIKYSFLDYLISNNIIYGLYFSAYLLLFFVYKFGIYDFKNGISDHAFEAIKQRKVICYGICSINKSGFGWMFLEEDSLLFVPNNKKIDSLRIRISDISEIKNYTKFYEKNAFLLVMNNASEIKIRTDNKDIWLENIHNCKNNY